MFRPNEQNILMAKNSVFHFGKHYDVFQNDVWVSLMNNLLLKTSHDCVCYNIKIKLWTGIEHFSIFFQNSYKNYQTILRM